ncbi:hypothetical protein DFH08DRAFT_950309 [Mycena albidolilacea]|uniref:Uncharacterized protein n=1 Tax=Mycena albidolilacea TaxID=1033008 RepID=A0AAD7F1Z5_9AGAR|nr:hypothetical protein DFH08DRAFT_950309 [Mycena albidolilacea]
MSKSQFSSPFHQNELVRTKNYLAGSLFESSFIFKTSKGANILTEIPEGVVDPDGPAPPDGVAVVIGTVIDTDLRVTTLGNWSKYMENTYNKPITSAKHTFLIIEPENDPTFAGDFTKAVTVLKRLQTKIAKTNKHLWLVQQNNGEDMICFAFHVFEPKTENSAPSIDMIDLPVPTECRDTVKELAESHVVRDFVVWDVDGTRLAPEAIESKLPGALVECYFGIEHRSFGGTDSFSGIINQVIILRPAQLKPPSPFKPSAAASKPFRAPILSAEQIHAQEQRAVGYFTTPISSPGPSNVFQTPTKRRASKEPDGSAQKRNNTRQGKNKDDESSDST